jgi:hypothetical protein
MTKPLSQTLQDRADARPKALEFHQKYLTLCNEYGAEVTTNHYGVTCVIFDNGIDFSFNNLENMGN